MSLESLIGVELLGCGRLAWRSLLRSKVLVGPAMASLAVAIGVASAMLSVVDTLLVRPLPYQQPHDLFIAGEGGTSTTGRGSTLPLGLLERWKTGSQTQAAFAGYWPLGPIHVAAEDAKPRSVYAVEVSAAFWRVLGVPLKVGREFSNSDAAGRGASVVILSERLSRDLWGEREDALGRTILLGAQPVTVVGVAASGFLFPIESATGVPDIFVPLPPGNPSLVDSGPRARLLVRTSTPAATAARLSALASAQLVSVGQAQQYGIQLQPLQEFLAALPRTLIAAMTLAVLSVLALSSVNVVQLFIAHARARMPQFGLQLCLGARRFHLFVQLMCEATLVVAVSGVLGLLLSILILESIATPLQQTLQLYRAPTLDWRLGVMTAALAATVALGIGGASASGLSRAPSVPARRAPDGSDRRFYSVVLFCQTALSFVLFFTAALLINSFGRLLVSDLGLSPHDVTAVAVRLAPGTPAAITVQSYRDIERRVLQVPGVVRTAMVDLAPLDGSVATGRVVLSGSEQSVEVDIRRITPTYFDVMAIRRLHGRSFVDADMVATPAAAIVNEALVRRWWSSVNPIGQRVRVKDKSFEVVGVVADARESRVHLPVVPTVYLPYSDPTYRLFAARTLLIRRSPGAGLGAALQKAVGSAVGPGGEVRTREMSDSLDLQVATPRTYSVLFGGVAALAIVLMVMGMLGIATSTTERQMRRAAIAVALGASVRREIVRLIVRSQLPVGLGLTAGAVAAYWSGSLLASQLVGVSTTDPPTMAITATVLAITAVCCAYLPARRFQDIRLADLLRET